MRKHYRIVERKYRKDTDELVEETVKPELTPYRANIALRCILKGFGALSDEYLKPVKTEGKPEYTLYASDFMPEYYFKIFAKLEQDSVEEFKDLLYL